MPNYTYKCTVCGYEFNKIQSFSSEPLEKCPKCNKKVIRIISGGTGVIFKGSGFYENDYKKKTNSTNRDLKSSGKKVATNSQIKKTKSKEKSINNSKKGE